MCVWRDREREREGEKGAHHLSDEAGGDDDGANTHDQDQRQHRHVRRHSVQGRRG